MILSIGMIVKNEEKYLERCLTALKPILDEIDSELIIADTGSTDKTVEIAKKFTKNVFYFEWINDFAAARNSTLERAKGEWFMFIDADEIIKDCTELIRFFKSGEYKAYNVATYCVRSYSNENDFKNYSDYHALRLIKKSKDVTFINPIHESLFPLTLPCKGLAVIADHYGYVFRGDGDKKTELATEKHERNLKMLLEMFEKEKATGNFDGRTCNQIADVYDILDQFDESMKYIDMGLDNIGPTDLAVIVYYSHKLALLMNLDRYEEIPAVCKRYFSKENKVRTEVLATDCYVHGVGAIAYYYLGRDEEAVSEFLKCFDLYKQYTDGKLFTLDLMLGTFRATVGFIGYCYNIFIRSCIRANKFDTAAAALKLCPLNELMVDKDYMLLHLILRLEVMEQTSYSKLTDLYYELDDFNKLQLIRLIRWKMFETRRHEILLKNFTDIVTGDKHLEDTAEIFRSYFINNSLTQDQADSYIGKHTASENEDVWCVMMLANLDITSYLKDPEFHAERCVRGIYLSYTSPMDALLLFANYDINAISPEGLETAAGVYGCAMIGAINNNLSIVQLFEKYGQIGLRWVNEHPESERIPGDIKAAICANDIAQARKNENYDRCAAEMKKLVSACPPIAPMVKAYEKAIQSEIRPTTPTVDPEFVQLAAQVKQNIRSMIAAGDFEEAENTLLELEELCPLDPEIELLKDEIYTLKGK